MVSLQGLGIEDILEAIVERIPPPADNIADHTTRALIFDSAYDPYRVSSIRLTPSPKALPGSIACPGGPEWLSHSLLRMIRGGLTL